MVQNVASSFCNSLLEHFNKIKDLSPPKLDLMHGYHTSLFLFTNALGHPIFWLTEFLTYVTTPYCLYVRKVRTKDTQHNQVGVGLVPVHSLLLLLCSDKSCDRQRVLYLWQDFSSQWLSFCGWLKYNFKECDKNIMWRISCDCCCCIWYLLFLCVRLD